jgi:hypothetical protein
VNCGLLSRSKETCILGQEPAPSGANKTGQEAPAPNSLSPSSPLLMANCSGDGRLSANAADDSLLASGDGCLFSGATEGRLATGGEGRLLVGITDDRLSASASYGRSLGRNSAERSVRPNESDEDYMMSNRHYDDDNGGSCRLASADEESLLGVGAHNRYYGGGVDTLRRGRDNRDTAAGYGGNLGAANRRIDSPLSARSVAQYPSIQVNPNFV